MDIKDKLKDRRKELNMTMLDVANRVGVSEATVSRWESGDIANMRRDKIVSLAKALQVHPSFIMGWEDESKGKEQPENELPLSESQKAILQLCELLSDKNIKKLIDYAELLKKADNDS